MQNQLTWFGLEEINKLTGGTFPWMLMVGGRARKKARGSSSPLYRFLSFQIGKRPVFLNHHYITQKKKTRLFQMMTKLCDSTMSYVTHLDSFQNKNETCSKHCLVQARFMAI
jgi:hypothetical protein